LDGTPAATRDAFQAALSTALQTSEQALVPKTRADRNRKFHDWVQFCAELKRPPDLSDVPLQETRLCYILVYGERIRSRISSRTGEPVRAGSVQAALLAVGTGIAHLGQPDPRKISPGDNRNHPLLADYLRALRDQDSPSERSYPANITIIRTLHDTLDYTHAKHGPTNRHVTDLCIIGFFWLLRPAEYLETKRGSRSEAFRLCDISFTLDGHRLVLATDPSLNDLNENRITRTTLTFNDQKNAVRGEQISHAATNDPLLCPCKAIWRICQRLRARNAEPTAPLYAYYRPDGSRHYIKPHLVTNALRHAAVRTQHLTGIDPFLLSARSLRPGGATALLCAAVDKDVIQLIGRWKSDAMLRYLHVAARASSVRFSQLMLDAGDYTFAPHTYGVLTGLPLPQQAPAEAATLLDGRNQLYDDATDEEGD
jgi:hypothetical protein